MGTLSRFFLGKPLPTRQIKDEKLTNYEGLATFSIDAISSTAYATEEILMVLVGTGLTAMSASVPIAIVITALIFLVSISYRQVIHAYPQGGGVYNVAKANLNESFALVGAASLMIDYVLTVAVSSAAGIAALTSAIPMLKEHQVGLCLLVIFSLTILNLRGVREAGKLFIYPTFVFIAVFAGMFIYGFVLMALGKFPQAPSIPPTGTIGIIGIALILRAFSSGCTAMTGIEAVSNGVKAFRTPESDNASRVLMHMVFILGAIFLGNTFFAYHAHIRPNETETIISQLARMLFGSSSFFAYAAYYMVQAMTLIILVLASNTPFAGFPRVAFQLAEDKYFPRQFRNLGSTGVYNFGIGFLCLFASALIILFGGSTHALIPLYAVGVFLGFTISQLGMIFHWKKQTGSHKWAMLLNAVGFMATSIVLVITFVAKLTHGAWMLPPAILGIMYVMWRINAHYKDMDEKLALKNSRPHQIITDRTIIIPASDILSPLVDAIDKALSYKPKQIIAVHVAISEGEDKKFLEEWQQAQLDGYIPYSVNVEVLTNEYRNITGTIIQFIKDTQARLKEENGSMNNGAMVILIPYIIPPKKIQHLLHNQNAPILRTLIENDPDIDTEILEDAFKVPEGPINNSRVAAWIKYVFGFFQRLQNPVP